MDSLLFVIGTRPEAIKLAPVVLEARKCGIRSHVLLTGQHEEMVAPILRIFDISPSYTCHIDPDMRSLSSLSSQVLSNIDNAVSPAGYDCVVVQGDTASTFMGALWGFYNKVPVAHVEAGLRTYDFENPFPEEMVRILISKLVAYNFCPTIKNKVNLIEEGVFRSKCHIVGNTVIDAMYNVLERPHVWHDLVLARAYEKCWSWNKKIVLLTLHRRENWTLLNQILLELKKLTEYREDVHFIYPVHPNPIVRGVVEQVFGSSQGENITLLPPLRYDDFIHLMSKSYLIVTDSGGIQEEAPYLRKPVVVVRKHTERQEAQDEGLVDVVGVNPVKIREVVQKYLYNDQVYGEMYEKSMGCNIYGYGKASELIVEILKGGYKQCQQ